MQQQQPDGTQQTVTTEQVTINVEAVQEQQQVQGCIKPTKINPPRPPPYLPPPPKGSFYPKILYL